MGLIRLNLARTGFLLVALGGIGLADEQPGIRAALQSPKGRKLAPEFALENSSGKTVKLKDYRGKVVLLDFWATWCTGCKKEIPWFVGFQNKYGAKNLAVVGVSLDGDGWKVLRPFLADGHVPYEVVLGNDATAKSYGIENMPDTFLIDQRGRVAAAYRAGLVDRGDIDENIKALLAKR